MACSPYGVREHETLCRAHEGSWKQTHVNQGSKQVTVASSLTPREVIDKLYSKPYHQHQMYANQELPTNCDGDCGMEIITIPDYLSDTIFDENEFAFVGQEGEPDSTESEKLCCDGGATSSLSSSFINCSDIKERVVPIQTAQGGTVMHTTHICLKTYFVRDRTGEL